jgi:hypothetical protein
MVKRKTGAGRRIEAQLALRQRANGSPLATGAHSPLTRREFIERIVAAATALGMPPLLASCGGSDDEAPAPTPPQRPSELRTLFFNFSHLGAAQTTHVLVAGGKRLPLTKVSDKPEVLRSARQGNEFLRSVPDDQITHHVEAAAFATSSVTLAYLSCAEDPAGGTWQMSSMYFNIPSNGVSHAYAKARVRTTEGPLPLSGKRRRYGVRAAASAQDLLEEHALIDTNSHAEALVGLHPELLSLEPNSAAHVHHNYISGDDNTAFLAGILGTMGPATPAGTTNVSGAQPWATLVPLSDNTTSPSMPVPLTDGKWPGQQPQPLKMSDGKLNQYYPDWNPLIDQNAGPAYLSIHPQVKNDESLGLDVTGFNPNTPPTAEIASQHSGKLWSRHDGTTSFARKATAVQASTGPTYTFAQAAVNPGLVVAPPDASAYTVLGDGRVQVRLDVAFNWFLRWLGVHVQFVDPNGNVIKTTSLPGDTLPNQPGPYPRTLDPDDTVVFADVLSSATTLLGVPVYPGSVPTVVKIPTGAQTLRLYYGGIGLSGSDPPELAGTSVRATGAIMTLLINYGITGIFMAAGVNEGLDPVIKKCVAIGGGLVVREVVALLGADAFNGAGGVPLLATAMNLLKTLLTAALSVALAEMVAAIAAELFAAQIIDSIPVAGQIARGISAATGAAELVQTSFEIAFSPPTYLFSITLTHDLSVKVLPDANNTQFPQLPTGYTLYYKVTYGFDGVDASPHTLDAVDVPDPTVKSIPITLTGIPRGGQVNITIGFYARKSGTPVGQNDWCAGKGTTGVIDNTLDQAPDLPITQIKVPIQSSTQYLHTRKVTLDLRADHVWTSTSQAPPYVAPPGSQVPGLGDFNAITVRQGRSLPPQQGYVGYAWKAFSNGVNGCSAAAPGQLDQLANLNTDAGNGGANAQNGYTRTSCGQQAGVQVGYNLLSHDAKNCYLDSTTLYLRPVQLDPPAFADPLNGLAFGQLNLGSTRLLLHPQGHIISINNDNHILETLRLPSAPMADADATKRFRARTCVGQGSRPGRITSPVAAAVSPEGVILVLEDSANSSAPGNNRISAFDIGGSPVQFFKLQKQPYYLQLDATPDVTYLDLAVEFTGYLYVLSKDANNNHRLDIYHPGQTGTTPICTTQGVNAARLTVDFWRDVYTLNYEVLQLPNGGGIPSAFTEPSVSLWVPTPPVV